MTMSNYGKAFKEAVDRLRGKGKLESKNFVDPYQSWYLGFLGGWSEAMDAKFDDRAALAKWHKSSKHVFCPCNEKERCESTCPHGMSVMSGVCRWCIDKFNEMETELGDRPLELFECRYDKPWQGKCSIKSTQEFCEEHRQKKCFKCDAQATRGCDATSALVCGTPMCDDHPHMHKYQ